MEVTLDQAARRLRVSVRQAQRLARSGRLQVVRQVGKNILVDDSSVAAVDSGRRSAGRRWAAETAWAAIELLALGDTERVSSSVKSRLRSRLRSVDVSELVRLASGRADAVLRLEQTIGLPAELRRRVMLSGRSALADADVARTLELTPGSGGVIEGYVRDQAINEVVDRFGLEPSGEGSVLLSVCVREPVDSLVTVALDLCERGTTRERSAAATFLDRQLRV